MYKEEGMGDTWVSGENGVEGVLNWYIEVYVKYLFI